MKTSAERIASLEFQIAFSETNLRWLASEPDSEDRNRCIATNQDGIASAQAEIARLQEASP